MSTASTLPLACSELGPEEPEESVPRPAVNRAVRGAAAGRYLAELLGLSQPFTAAQFWRLARTNQIPVVRLGRSVYARTSDLDAFVSTGGSVRPAQGDAR
jgi:hypothetical protein